MRVFLVNAHVVSEQSMHANVFEAASAPHLTQLILPIRAQSFVGPTRANAFLERRIKRPLDCIHIDSDHPDRRI